MTYNRKATRYYSSKQEKDVAKAMDAKVQCNSGATPFYKGDVISEKILFECKTTVTEKLSFTVKKEQLDKLDLERMQMKRDISALVFNFGPKTENYYVLTERGLKSLLKEIIMLKGDLE